MNEVLPRSSQIFPAFLPEERAKKAAAAGLPPSAAAAAAAEALAREAAPAEIQVTVGVLGHQGRGGWGMLGLEV